ncbi:MAG: DMT family transporter [Paracoccaceae bacterium]
MKKRTAYAMLLLAAFFWGAGNVANKTVLEHLSPSATVALRCVIAALVIAPLALREARQCRQPAFLASAVVVSALFAGALYFQQIAFASTTVTNASFLINTASILTPLVAWATFGERQGLPIVGAAGITVIGAFMMTGGSFSPSTLNRGDVFCLISALLYAGWMVALGRHAVAFGRPFCTSLVQFILTATVLGTATLRASPPLLADVAAAWPELLALGVFSTAAAFVLMARAQEHVTPSAAAVLVSAESLFGAAGGYLLLAERTPVFGMVGAALILAGIVLGMTMTDCRPAPPKARAAPKRTALFSIVS